jgi:hypothetical protein
VEFVWDKYCLFVIFFVLGLYLLAFFWTVLDNLLVVIFGKVHIIAVIMPDYFLGTNKGLIFWRIFFVAYLDWLFM